MTPSVSCIIIKGKYKARHTELVDTKKLQTNMPTMYLTYRLIAELQSSVLPAAMLLRSFLRFISSLADAGWTAQDVTQASLWSCSSLFHCSRALALLELPTPVLSHLHLGPCLSLTPYFLIDKNSFKGLSL